MASSGWMRMVDESGHERFEFFVSDFGEDELNLLVGWLQRKRERGFRFVVAIEVEAQTLLKYSQSRASRTIDRSV